MKHPAKRLVPLLAALILLSACAPKDLPDDRGDTVPAFSLTSPDVTPTPVPTPDPTPTPTPTPRPTPDPSTLEEYTGPYYHVFFHFLIAFPDIAYSNPYGKSLDTDCVTPSEFRRALEELYKNNFILYDINKLIEIKMDEDGGETVKLLPALVPKGKKPLVMSFDDVCYYQKNLGKGTCDRLIIDAKGEFAMQTKMADGSVKITYDNDLVPMLEAFVKEHPDFSPFGMMGTLALTGYDGVLGYRVNRDAPNRDAEIEAVRPVIEKLKQHGWNFASHSYGHRHFEKVSLEKIRDDTQKWNDEIAPVVGATKVFVYPYGETVKDSDPKFDALYQKGFRIFCGVGMKPYIKGFDSYMFMDRQSIDGYTLRNSEKYLEPLMNIEAVFDPVERHEKTPS